LCLGLLAAPAFSNVVSTQFFETWAEVDQVVTGGFEFYARGDTDHVRLTRATPLAVEESPYDLWVSGVERSFQVTYNFGGIPAGIRMDDIHAVFDTDIPIDAETHHLLVTAWLPEGGGGGARSSGVEVALTNLKVTLPNLTIHNVGVDLVTDGTARYLLIETDVPLTGGFILSGAVAFTWDDPNDPPPPPPDQWFEVSPVRIPEPAGGLLALGGVLLIGLRRRR
jgi:hypothetical protein